MGNPSNQSSKDYSSKKLELLTTEKLAMQKNSKLPLFKVNLLIHKEDQIEFQTKLIKWLLSSGRFIVVLVEILTVCAFVYRYKLDNDLADLQEKIKSQVLYVQSLKNDEILIRETQFQLATIKQIRTQGEGFTSVLLNIAKLTPKNTTITSIALNHAPTSPDTTFIITGQTATNAEISAFVKALQKDPMFTNATLTNVSLQGTTTFNITGGLGNKGVKSS